MKKIFSLLTLCALGMLGFTTDVNARTECSVINCDCCTASSTCAVLLSQGGLASGCSNGKQCGDTSSGTIESLTRDSAWVCTAAASGYRLTRTCGVQACPTGCKTCCTSSNGNAVCTSCQSGYTSSGDTCVASSSSSGGVSTKCDINEIVYTTKAKCLSGCGSTTCLSCLDRETMEDGWQCGTIRTLSTECTISNCKTCNKLGTKCTTCNAGYYLSSGSCIACPAGKIANEGSTSCTDCSAGTYNTGTGNQFCMMCNAGYYSSAGASVCTMCGANTYSAKGASSCTSCGSGKWSNPGSSSCSDCPANCKTCSNGTSCDQCVSGYIWSSTAGKCVNSSLCSTVCESGEAYEGGFNNGIKMICEKCPSVSNGYCGGCPSSDCVKPLSCPAGYVKCKPGYYKSGATCVACSAGNYQPDDGATRTSCMVCSTGYSTSGTAASSCTSCNTLSPVSGGTCTECIGANNCTKATCPSGKVLDTSSQSCVTSGCAAGQYKDGDSCVSCPAGYYCTGDGTKAPCEPGSYSGSTGAAACTKCMQGKYQPESGKTSCTNCPAGTFAGEYGATSCSYCEAGSYSAGGSYTCTACTSGMYAPNAGSTSCMECPVGTTATKDGKSCETCPAGKYCDGTFARDCTSNTYSTGGASACSSCSNITITGGTCNTCTATGECLTMTCDTSAGYAYYAEGNTCLYEESICKKFYGVYNGTCTKCLEESRCTAAKCESSALFFSADDYACICPNGYAYNGSTKKCEEPLCTSVMQAYSATEKTCVDCSKLHTVANGTCTACTSSSCSEVSCKTGYKDVGGVCKSLKDLFPIPNGVCTEAGDTECSKAVCDSPDLVFAGQIDWAMGCICKDSTLVFDEKTNMCILDKCPEGTYKDTSTNTCKACSTIDVGDGTCLTCIEGGQCTEFSCNSNAVLNVNRCETCGANTMKMGNRCCSTLDPPGWGTTWVCDRDKYLDEFGLWGAEFNAYINCEYGSVEAYAPNDPMEACTPRACKDVPVTGGVCADCDTRSGVCTSITCESGYRVAEKADGWKEGTSRYCIQDFASDAVKYCITPLHYVASHEACVR